MQDIEIWKPINGTTQYFVSSFGRVKSIKKSGEIFLKPEVAKRGYMRITFSIDKVPQRILLHRLVAEYFCFNHKPELQVNHINNNPLDNRAVNLEWVTAKENVNKAIESGRWNPQKGNAHWAMRNPEKRTRGERMGSAKIKDKDIPCIKELVNSLPQWKVAKMYGVCQQQISRIVTGQERKCPA